MSILYLFFEMDVDILRRNFLFSIYYLLFRFWRGRCQAGGANCRGSPHFDDLTWMSLGLHTIEMLLSESLIFIIFIIFILILIVSSLLESILKWALSTD